jgi:anti-anti-sigma factor
VAYTLASPSSLLGRLASLPPPALSWWMDDDRDTGWISIAGELSAADVPQLTRTLFDSQSQTPVTVLDLRELTLLSTRGAQAIVTAGVNGRRLGRRLVLLRGRPDVDRVLGLTAGAGELEIHDLHAGEPAVLVLLQLAELELA